MNLIKQQDPQGCVTACIAMITNQSYEQVKQDIGLFIAYPTYVQYLAYHGFACQVIFQVDIGNKPRPMWPLEPWAPMHICSVDAGLGMGSHAVLMDQEGKVIDPIDPPLTRHLCFDYKSVAHMVGVFNVGDRPQR